MGTTWLFQKLNCIHMYRSVWKHSVKHSASDYRTIQLQFDRRWLSSARCGTWQVTLERDNPHRFRWGRVMLRKPPLVSLYYLGCPLRHLKTFPILPWINCISDITDRLDRYGYAFPPMALEITGEPKAKPYDYFPPCLTHWGRVTHIRVSKLVTKPLFEPMLGYC